MVEPLGATPPGSGPSTGVCAKMVHSALFVSPSPPLESLPPWFTSQKKKKVGMRQELDSVCKA
jgi:hypothetical protein